MKAQHIPVITIDGPSGSGKGTLALKLSQKLGWKFLDSGAIYRILALCISNHSINNQNDDAIIKIALNLDIDFQIESNELLILLENEKVNTQIRTEEIAKKASFLAKDKKIRQALLQRQRDFRVIPGLIADGRDMGSVVFPDASLKFYLTANSTQRAKRRFDELKQKKAQVSFADILKNIEKRDKQDMNRKTSPLVCPKDAILIDSSNQTAHEVFLACYKHISKNLFR